MRKITLSREWVKAKKKPGQTWKKKGPNSFTRKERERDPPLAIRERDHQLSSQWILAKGKQALPFSTETGGGKLWNPRKNHPWVALNCLSEKSTE